MYYQNTVNTLKNCAFPCLVLNEEKSYKKYIVMRQLWSGEHIFPLEVGVTVYAKLAPNPPPPSLTSSFTRSVAMTAGYWQVWQNFDCSVSLRAGACHLSGVSKALLGWWHLQTWTAERGNVLKRLDNALTDGPVWTLYIYISANCTKDTTDISRNTHELDMKFISQSI